MRLNNYEKEHLEKIRPYLSECCVLLRSNGDFPIETPGKIALYGSGVRKTIKGGTGSGEVNSRFFITVEQGFEDAGFCITTQKWLDDYDNLIVNEFEKFKKDLKKKAKAMHTNILMMCMGASMPEPEYEFPLNGEGDTAVYVLSRLSGENADRDVTKGEIFLTDTEIRDIQALKHKYKRFMLVLNTGGVVDLSPLEEIQNILILSQLGVETGSVLADIVLGKVNPSGKLTTTWSAWESYPELIEFGGYDDTRYREGIYVGYRYFDTVGATPLFPFGFGLSYTTFEISRTEVTYQRSEINMTVWVRNTGTLKGKETVQLYVSVPAVTLDQPYQTLAAFGKTKELSPGESSQLTLHFDMKEIASFDTKRACYVLEAGRYVLRIGNSSRNTMEAAKLILDQEIVIRQVKNCLGKPDFADFVPVSEEEARSSADLMEIPLNPADFDVEEVDYNAKYEISAKVKSLSDEDLLHLAMGYFNPKGGLTGIVGNAGSLVAGSAGETAHVDGFKTLIMADGPAGIRISQKYFVDKKGVHSMAPPMPESMMPFASGIVKVLINMGTAKPKRKEDIQYQYCTAIPIGTAIAQSWNPEFAEICGDIVGKEMERFNVDLWLAPALNIHRSIRCGRNFEYYSEDPLISGLMASAMTKGVQKHPGKGVTIKHFAANNQEYNRTSSNSQVSERAMREIYMKGFEICVKRSDPAAVMTSYNLVNGQHTSTRRDLIEDILRCEFGFNGIVMTDWIINGGMLPKDAKYKSPKPAEVAAAGGELFMPGSKADYEDLVAGYQAGVVSREQLEINAERILRAGFRMK